MPREPLSAADVVGVIDHQPMTPFQTTAVAVCTALNAIDGFDVLAISFAAPTLAREWQLSDGALGLLFSAGLAGMTAGSLLVAPLADRLGRRWMTLASLLAITVGMLLSAATHTPAQMAAARLLTGLGIGAMLPSLTTVVAEYSSARRRELCVSVMSAGYPIGATLGGMAAVYIVQAFGWRGIFAFGGLVSLTMVPLVLWRLPESLAFLMVRRPPDALPRLNLLMHHLGRETLDELPEAPAHAPRPRALDVVRGRLGASSAALWTAFFCVMLSFYFVMSWTPKLLVDAGFNPQQGISGGVLLNVGGIAGATILGLLAARLGVFRLVSATMVAGALAILAFARFGHTVVPALSLAVVVGYFLVGSMVGLYAVLPSVYPAGVRNTGAGMSVGVGRIGAILAPYSAGLLLQSGSTSSETYVVFAVPLLLAAAATFVLGRLRAADTGALLTVRSA